MTFKPTVPKRPIAAMFSSPGPCYQLPTLVGKQGHDLRSTHQRAPSYQFGIRHGGARTDNCSPGPKYNFTEFQVYRDELSFKPMTFKPTVPKRPIAAMFSSPGPCYQLPSMFGKQGHDLRSTHQRAPSCQFGIRHGARTNNCSPGPKYNFTEFQVYRDELSFRPMTFKPTVPKGPIAAMYSSPGPCYQLPTLVGQQGHDLRSTHQRAPSYQFGIRHGARTDNCSPGPKYNFTEFQVYRDGKDGTPHFSLYSRPKDSTTFKTPGPGTYSPESTTPALFAAAPMHSFGQRHKHRTSDLTPAPNSYCLPGLLGKTIQGGKTQAPSYTVLGRKAIGSFHEDLAKTPGPCAYNVSNPGKYRMKAPEYSMLSRNAPPGDTTIKPGPGAHSPEKSWPHKRSAPGYSFGIRHSPYTTPLIIEV